MFTKKHSQENKEMMDRAKYLLFAFSQDDVTEAITQDYPNIKPERIRRIVDKTSRLKSVKNFLDQS